MIHIDDYYVMVYLLAIRGLSNPNFNLPLYSMELVSAYVEIVFTSKQCSSSSVSKIMNLNSQFYVRKKVFMLP